MGFGGISIWQLLIVLLILVMLFGTRRLKNIGGDLGQAIKSFRKSMNEESGSDSSESSASAKKVENRQTDNKQAPKDTE